MGDIGGFRITADCRMGRHLEIAHMAELVEYVQFY